MLHTHVRLLLATTTTIITTIIICRSIEKFILISYIDPHIGYCWSRMEQIAREMISMT